MRSTTASSSSSRSSTYRYSDIERTPSRDATARMVAAPMPCSSTSSSVVVTIRSSDRPRPGRLRRPGLVCAFVTKTSPQDDSCAQRPARSGHLPAARLLIILRSAGFMNPPRPCSAPDRPARRPPAHTSTRIPQLPRFAQNAAAAGKGRHRAGHSRGGAARRPDWPPAYRAAVAYRLPFSFFRSFRSSRSSEKGSFSIGCPPATARPRSSSALNSAPNRMATLEIHIQIRKTMTPARLP